MGKRKSKQHNIKHNTLRRADIKGTGQKSQIEIGRSAQGGITGDDH